LALVRVLVPVSATVSGYRVIGLGNCEFCCVNQECNPEFNPEWLEDGSLQAEPIAMISRMSHSSPANMDFGTPFRIVQIRILQIRIVQNCSIEATLRSFPLKLEPTLNLPQLGFNGHVLKVFALGAGMVWPAAWKLEMVRLMAQLPHLPKLDATALAEFITKLEANPMFSGLRDHPSFRDALSKIGENPMWVIGALIAFALAWYGRRRRQDSTGTLEPSSSSFSIRLTSFLTDARVLAARARPEWRFESNPALARCRASVLWACYLS
jgi:hypothetical protein